MTDRFFDRRGKKTEHFTESWNIPTRITQSNSCPCTNNPVPKLPKISRSSGSLEATPIPRKPIQCPTSGSKILSAVHDPNPPELEDVLEVVPEDCDCSMAGLVDTLLLVLVPSSAVFLKKLCCRA